MHLLMLFVAITSIRAFELPEAALRRRMEVDCDLKAMVRPVNRSDEVVDVYIAMNADNFRGISQEQQSFSLFGTLEISWTNPCTTWEPSVDPAKIGSFLVPSDQYWHPKFLLTNAISDPTIIDKSMEHSFTSFYFDGEVSLATTKMFTAKCQLRLTKFPFDTQSCSLVFDSLHSVYEIKLHLDSELSLNPLRVDQERFVSPNEVWMLDDVRSAIEFVGIDGYTPRAVFTFNFKRRHQLYLVNVFLPIWCLSILLLATGFIPPKRPERPICCIAVLLAFAFLHSILASSIPESYEVPYVILFLGSQQIVCLICSLYSLVTVEIARWESLAAKCIQWQNIQMSTIRLMDIIFFCGITIITFGSQAALLSNILAQ